MNLFADLHLVPSLRIPEDMLLFLFCLCLFFLLGNYVINLMGFVHVCSYQGMLECKVFISLSYFYCQRKEKRLLILFTENTPERFYCLTFL